MGHCCSSAVQQTVPNTTSIHTERNTMKETKTQPYEQWSSSDYEIDTQYSGAEDTEIETSMSMTIEYKQKIIDGFKDAVRKGNDSLVMYYVREHPSLHLLETRFMNGDNALHIAVRIKSYNLIIYLLSQGISPNSQNEINGDSALHTAARIREFKCVALLFKHNADINITNNEHETALTIASEHKDEDIVDLLSNGMYYCNHMNHKNKNKVRESNILSTKNEQRLESELTEFTNDILKDNKQNKQIENMKLMNINDSTLTPPDANINYHNTFNPHYGNGDINRPDLILEEKLEPKCLRKLREIKIARNNPFSKLRRENTQKAMAVMERITHEAGKLPILEAWLEKKKKSPPYSWQKRWVIVKESHFLWSDKQRDIKDPKSPKERAKFNGNFNLMCITEISAVIKKSKSQRKFKIIAKEGTKSQTKEFLFKAASKQDRDYWVKSLNIHINHMRELLVYLGTKD